MSRRRLENGDLLVMYQDVGKEIEGYIQKPDNENHYVQQMPDCILRKSVKCGTCSTPVYKNKCDLGRPLDCVECPERIEE